MIVAEVKMKGIPETCTKCKFKTGYTDESYCLISKIKIPYVYDKKKRNWTITKPKKCPLREIGDV